MRQEVYTTLMQAQESAKLEVVRDTPVITIVEDVQMPIRPDSRGALLKTIVAFLFGCLLGAFVIAIRDALQLGTGVRPSEGRHLDRA
jgi:uncharacterized protein involved in exopolysaccharide biosynthesis